MSARDRGAIEGSEGGDNVHGYSRGPYAKTFDKRRREILSMAWTMIAENEGSEFTLQDLSKRCNVALRTIYNAFGDKDGVIAAAAAAHHSEVLQAIDLVGNQSWTLSEAIEITRRVAQETAMVPGFSQVTSSMYFVSRGHPNLTSSLRQMPASILQAWLRSDEVDHKLVKAVGQEALEASHADAQWGVVAQWCAGEIPAEQIEIRMVINFLMVAAAIGNRVGRTQAKRMLAEE